MCCLPLPQAKDTFKSSPRSYMDLNEASQWDRKETSYLFVCFCLYFLKYTPGSEWIKEPAMSKGNSCAQNFKNYLNSA